MKKEDIEKILPLFKKYSDRDFDSVYIKGPKKAEWYFHKGEDYFQIIIFEEDNSVYQLDTEADTFGIELETIESLQIRFESFTGEKLENIDPSWDEIE